KGSLAALTGPHRASQPGHTVRVIDPFGVLETSFPEIVEAFPHLKSEGYNPLTNLDPDSERFNDDAMNMAKAMIKPDGLKEKHWAQSAQTLVKVLIMAIRVAIGETAQLDMIRHLVTARPELMATEIDRLIKEHGERYPAIAAALNRFTAITSAKE